MDQTRKNPYRELPRFSKRYVGRETAQEELTDKLRKGVNSVVLGPEGMGKSALLAGLFTPEYCGRMALEEHILINQISYPTDLATQDIYSFFAEAVRDAAEILDYCGEETLYEDIMDRAMRYREENREPQRYFQRICKYIRMKGYSVVLVIDQFERFTSSTHVLAEHHDVMRNVLVDKNLCFVVATDFDFDRESLPPNVSGSLFLQLFSGHEVCLKGLSEGECGLFLEGISGQRDFSPEELGKLHRLTGGVPTLLCPAACCAFEHKLRGEDIPWRGVKEAVLRECSGLMERWLGILTHPEAQLLQELAGQIQEAVPISFGLRDGAAPLLLARGLIVDLGDNCYDFNSRLFQDYCIQNPPQPRRPRALLTQKPTPVSPSPEPSAAPEGWPPNLPWTPGGVIYYEDKSTHVHSGGGTIQAGAVQVHNTVVHSEGLSVSELLGILGSAGSSRGELAAQLVQRLNQCLPAGGLPALPDGLSQEEREEQEQLYDEAFHQMDSGFLADLEVDEDQEVLNVSLQEQQTLDERFLQARTRCRAGLTDELLSLVSERCRLYLKLSVVVEDALSILGSETMRDCSPHLVLYGKALEQTLRDNLFELFHREERLSIYDTYSHRENEYSNKNFRNKDPNEAFIGNFTCLIYSKAAYLGQLCAGKKVTAPEGELSEQQWVQWWRNLRDSIDQARRIRNLADHPDNQLPTAEDLDRMCALLFGTPEEAGLLSRTGVGKALLLELFPPEIDPFTGSGMIGSRTLFRCTERTKSGGLKGRLVPEEFEASVSPRQVKRYCAALGTESFEQPDAPLEARVLEYKIQDGRSFFCLELLEPSAVGAAP